MASKKTAMKSTKTATATSKSATHTRPYVVVRSGQAGVFAGELVSKNDHEVQLVNARRLWYWSGAASLSQLAMEGVKNPGACKFAMPVTVTVGGWCEILDTTPAARKSIEGVPVWRQ